MGCVGVLEGGCYDGMVTWLALHVDLEVLQHKFILHELWEAMILAIMSV